MQVIPINSPVLLLVSTGETEVNGFSFPSIVKMCVKGNSRHPWRERVSHMNQGSDWCPSWSISVTVLIPAPGYSWHHLRIVDFESTLITFLVDLKINKIKTSYHTTTPRGAFNVALFDVVCRVRSCFVDKVFFFFFFAGPDATLLQWFRPSDFCSPPLRFIKSLPLMLHPTGCPGVRC